MQGSLGRALARVYEQKRSKAVIRRDEAVRQAYRRCPDLERVDKAIAKAGAELLLEAIEPGRPQRAAPLKLQLNREREQLLKQAGIDPDFDQVKYSCELCQDTGRRGKELCTCYRQVLIPLLVERANLQGMPKASFAGFDLDLFSSAADPERYNSPISPRAQMTGLLKVCRSFVEAFPGENSRNMLFVGKPGTGKTFLMLSVAREMLSAGHSVFYTTAPQMFENLQAWRTLKSSFSPDPTRLEEAEAIHDSLVSCSLLLIDDLGTEAASASRYADLLSVLDSRIRPDMRTIISSNSDPTSLRDTYDERVLSRLVGNFAVYRFFGEDIRLVLNRRRRR